jgi:hypothetical protein
MGLDQNEVSGETRRLIAHDEVVCMLTSYHMASSEVTELRGLEGNRI